ncbi:hypothetical protein JOB18_040296 [Solea senegalensis]|uniref:Uncharacterized protein n=1 Tax=Solea senegalensis TaxID=28829 RepID=A0AAV6QKF1_SOLSE|nr:hypothetical protein JOB18_040296 [Solea senegalensis]
MGRFVFFFFPNYYTVREKHQPVSHLVGHVKLSPVGLNDVSSGAGVSKQQCKAEVVDRLPWCLLTVSVLSDVVRQDWESERVSEIQQQRKGCTGHIRSGN